MALPLEPPVMPQLARSSGELPDGDGWLYEPKLDGFRAVVFVDGSDLFVQSRNGKALGRYFPELRFPEGRYILDGELVIRADGGGENFEALQERIHPAASRVARLAEEMPATFVAFDILELVGIVRPHETGEHGASDPNRWSADRDREWRGLRPDLVAEVSFDHKSGHRIRHGARLLRFRDDKRAEECGLEQLES